MRIRASNLIPGVILLALGGVWILQGTNVLKGGLMGGHLQYAVLGVVVGLAGLFLTYRGLTSGRAGRA